jgi:hypothetical protein
VQLTVHVTEQDIAKGVKHQCDRCPVARAVTRATGKPCLASGFQLDFYESADAFEDDTVFASFEVPTPAPVKMFMQAFDRGEDVAPFAFEITMPDEWEHAPKEAP